MKSQLDGQRLSLRVSVTDRCMLRCTYCIPSGGLPKLSRDDVISFEEIVRFVHEARLAFALSKVHVTGGEPLLRRGIVDLISMLAREAVPDLALTTNGQLLADVARDLKRAGLHRVNVNLHSLSEKTYATITGGGAVNKAVRGIEEALRAGFRPVKVNTVVLRGYNDLEVTEMARFALANNCVARFIELMPIGCARANFRRVFVPASEVRARLEEAMSLKPITRSTGQSSQDFLATDVDGRTGIVGFIAAQSEPFCDGCTRLRLTSTGQLISCLACGTGPDVRPLLRSSSPAENELLRSVMARALKEKHGRESFCTAQPMFAVGG